MDLSIGLDDVVQDPFKVIAAPVRRRILRLLWDREQNAGDIAANFTISWPAVSQHLRILRDTGLVNERREGRNRIYLVRKEALGSLRRVLEDEFDGSPARIKEFVYDGTEELNDCE
jgi:DNA-binding transcriptional ArsR family regulator